MKNIFLAWKPYCTRSHNIANHFGATNFYIYPFPSDGNPIKALSRYFISFFKTLWVLYKEKADLIFSLNQPAPLIFAIYFFTSVFKGKYVLDSHSAPFNDPRLTLLKPAYKFFACRALFNINTNTYHKRLVESWGGKSFVIGDVPIDFRKKYPRRNVSDKSIVVVLSFMFDEPLDAIWESVRRMPDVSFHVTGNYRKAPKKLLRDVPANMVLEGFLSRDDYLGLLLSTKAVMSLTTRDFTMQMGAYEALSLERPIITSDWQILRESFGDGAIYVKNNPESICYGVGEVLNGYEKYKRAVILQRRRRKEYFDRTRKAILLEVDKLNEKHEG